LQCKIDYKDKDTYFSRPDIPESTLIISNVDFRLQDNITHADLGPKKKELVEQYSAHIICDVYDIVEKNGQELYYCHNANLNSQISNKFDGRSWVFDNTGIYDAKNDFFKISGNFTGTMPNSNTNLSDALTTGEWNTTQQIQENQTDYGEQIKEGFKKAIEKSISNMTGIPFDLDKNYTEQEQALMNIKLLVYICNNQEKQTGIDPEVLKYRCDVTMKELRDKGLIE
jgi:hypothetical protein